MPISSSTKNGPQNRLMVACLLGAHGIKGEIKVKSFFERPQDILREHAFFDHEGRSFPRILSLRPQGLCFIAKFEGISDRDQAEMLKGQEMFVDRDALVPLAVNEYYAADLVGMEAVTQEGELIGKVVAVENYGAGPLLVIHSQKASQSFMIPFRNASVPSLDAAQKIVHIDANFLL